MAVTTGNVLSPSTMLESAKTIRSAEDGIKSKVDQIKVLIEEIGENWTDANGKKFVERFGELEASVRVFYESCDRLANLLEAVLKAYQENVYNPTSRAVNSEQA